MKSASIYTLIVLGALIVSNADAAPIGHLQQGDVLQMAKSLLELVSGSEAKMMVDESDLTGLIQAFLEGIKDTALEEGDTDFDVAQVADMISDTISDTRNMFNEGINILANEVNG